MYSVIITTIRGLFKATARVFLNSFSILSLLVMGMDFAYADPETIGSIAQRLTGAFGPVAQMITAAAYISGLGFTIGAIMKFKQHKDNPTQIPVGTPIAMLLIAAAFIWMPSVIGITGASLFSQPQTSGVAGILYTGAQ